MCTGQLDVRYVLEAFLRGADGVLVAGCKLGECHYFDGNYQARLKIDATKRMLKKAGIEPERLRMEFMSSAEGAKFADTAREFALQVADLGPTPMLNEERSKRLERNIEALLHAMSRPRLRALIGKWRRVVEQGNVYGMKIEAKKWYETIEKSIDEEMTRSQILMLLQERPRSCGELAEEMGVDPAQALRQLVFLRHKNLVDVQAVDGRTPVYQVL
jgi:coenzyme F420-reducing hydrogenase delta subunit/DNA-binding transcriptional ArsR family regulator